ARLAGMVQSRIKTLEKKDNKNKLESISDLDFEFSFKAFDTRVMMSIDDLSFGYQEDHLLINNLSFEISKGDKVAIVGKNGRGKSTLLRLLAQQLELLVGTIKKHPQLLVGYYGQVAEQELNSQFTVEEEIATVLPNNNREKARSIAGAMMFEGPMALKKCEVLSGGEKARVLLGKLIASPTHCLLLDEPSNHLDMQSIDSLVEALSVYEGAVVLVTHNEMILHNIANKLIIFDGDFPYVFLGTYQEFLEDKGFSEEEPIKKKSSKKSSQEKKNPPLKQEYNVRIKQCNNEISGLEEEIHQAELRIKDIQEELFQKQGNEIVILRKALALEYTKIDELFPLLDEQYRLLEDLKNSRNALS
ncbi:MAG: ATP-binding cassette domain-containing protein, partial [Brevinema sp.]